MSLVLIQCIPAYLGIKGGLIFLDFRIFGSHFTYKSVYYNLYIGYKFVSKPVQIYKLLCAKLYVRNLYITNLYILFQISVY
jgi:hypothetical protein